MFFISPEKFFSFSRYSSFCHDFLVMQEIQLDYKGKVKFNLPCNKKETVKL